MQLWNMKLLSICDMAKKYKKYLLVNVLTLCIVYCMHLALMQMDLQCIQSTLHEEDVAFFQDICSFW